jgi:large subunit ribosomal protein L30
MPGKLEIKQVRSLAGSNDKQRRVMRALGFRHREQVVIHDASPSILGMIDKIRHLVEVTKKND